MQYFHRPRLVQINSRAYFINCFPALQLIWFFFKAEPLDPTSSPTYFHLYQGIFRWATAKLEKGISKESNWKGRIKLR